MELIGHVRNGVVVLDGGAVLPEGETVRIIRPTSSIETDTRLRKTAKLPFVKSNQPGSHTITTEMIAEAQNQEDRERYVPYFPTGS